MKHVIKNITIGFILFIGFFLFILSNQLGGLRAFIVSSGSMEPTIHIGSLILTLYTPPDSLRKNDIITFRPPTKQPEFVTHRITQVLKQSNPTIIKTKGDANKNEDLWTLAGGGVVGKVIYTIPYLGYLFSFTQTKLGILLFILLPAVYLITNEIITIIQTIKNHRKKSIVTTEKILACLFAFSIIVLTSQSTSARLTDSTSLKANVVTITLAPPTITPTPSICGGNTTVIISNNGAGSINNVSVSNTCSTTINQTNNRIN